MTTSLRGTRRLLLIATLAAALLIPETAGARKLFNAQKWRPSPHSLDLFQVEGARVNHGYTATAYAMYNVASNPVDPMLELVGTLDVLASVSLWDFFSVGIDVPLHIHRSGTTFSHDPSSGEPDFSNLATFTMGDLRTSMKVSFMKPRRYGVGLAASLDITVPTGGEDGFTAEPGVTLRPRLIFEGTGKWVQGMVNIAYFKRFEQESFAVRDRDRSEYLDWGCTYDPLNPTACMAPCSDPFDPNCDEHTLVPDPSRTACCIPTATNDCAGQRICDPSQELVDADGTPLQFGRVGQRVRAEDEIQFMAGLGITLGIEELQLILEADLSTRVQGLFEWQTTRLELDGGLRYRMKNGLAFQAGAGGGVLTGYGDPSWRFFASFGYMPATFAPKPVYDSDSDGIDDPVDSCPTSPEDYDGYEDQDGCPEFDNDGDGVVDTSDKCPLVPEDKDGFQDEDGCPEPDNDNDGVLDKDDGCPLDPEDIDGYQDADGCPEADNDGDGILDAKDQCPNEPEDFDNCQDADGCPEPGSICVTEKKLVITDKIYFRTNRAKIRKISYPLLDEIAQVINAHPEILKLEIQGHTDSRGRDKYNLKLSKKRAKAVMDHLVKVGGVDPARLVSQGYGETAPIADNETEEGRAANRRVEFVILERAEKKKPE